MRRGIISLLTVGIATFSLTAAPMIFFGEDLNPNQGANLTNSNAAHDDFFSNLIGVGTEDFESFATGATAPLAVDFGAAGTATLNGGGAIQSGYSTGRFPISGEKYWEASTGTGMFTIDFSEAVAAFGFYGTDIGDFNGQIQVSTAGGLTETFDIPHTQNAPNATALFWGVIDTEDEFTSISFANTGSSGDWFGFDDFSIGSRQQVSVPEPASISLLGIGLLSLVGFAKIRKRR